LDFSAAFFGSWGRSRVLVSLSVPETLQPDSLVRFLLATGSPIVAAVFGIVVWKELKGGDMRVKILAALMIALFVCGLAMIGVAPLYLHKPA